MRPPFSYYGGKIGMAPLITRLLPAHRVYIEPFFGSGAVLFEKRPAPNEVVNDRDGAIVTFFRVLRDRPDDLARVCALTPYARDEFDAADVDEPGLDDLEVARRFWSRVNQSFSKTAGRNTGWSVTTARNQSSPVSTQSRIDRFHACAQRLARVSIENCDAVDLIARLAKNDAVVYCDPPYPAPTRSNRTTTGAGDYRVDMFHEDEHRRLAEVLHATPAAVVLSGYPCDLYDLELYPEWHTTDVQVHVHSSNSTTTERGERTERLWSNRPLAEVHQFELWQDVIDG